MDVVPKLVQGGGVPGGHYLPFDGKREPHVPCMSACHSVRLRHSDVVVDIGAYCGTFALYAARFPVKRVVAYEPTPRSFRILQMSQQPNLELVNAAVVGDDRKSVGLFVSSGIGVTNSIVLSHKKERCIEVPAVRYEDAVRDATVVKVDVEGAEYTYDLLQPQLRALIVDWHPIPKRRWEDAARATQETFRAAGFRCVFEATFESGWSTNSAWLRDVPDQGGGYAPMLEGRECCGCGTPVSARAKALCLDCSRKWTAKQRAGFVLET